jgi:hypothetical protein
MRLQIAYGNEFGPAPFAPGVKDRSPGNTVQPSVNPSRVAKSESVTPGLQKDLLAEILRQSMVSHGIEHIAIDRPVVLIDQGRECPMPSRLFHETGDGSNPSAADSPTTPSYITRDATCGQNFQGTAPFHRRPRWFAPIPFSDRHLRAQAGFDAFVRRGTSVRLHPPQRKRTKRHRVVRIGPSRRPVSRIGLCILPLEEPGEVVLAARPRHVAHVKAVTGQFVRHDRASPSEPRNVYTHPHGAHTPVWP